MHTEIFKQIDLLIEMSGSLLDDRDIEADLIQVNKEIQNKKQRLDDLKSMMNDARYFNASSELVDKNIEVSLKSKIIRFNQKLKEIEKNLKGIKEREESLDRVIASLKEEIEENQKYVNALSSKIGQDSTYKKVVDQEKRHLQDLEEELKEKEQEYEEISKEVELHEQAKEEIIHQRNENEANLKEVQDNLSNPNSYINEELKQQDERELSSLNEDLDLLQKKKLEYLTDPNMIGADAKELIINHNYTEALNKIKELVKIVKAKPYMDVTNLSVLDEQLEKLENQRSELSQYIDSKNYAEMNSEAIKKRKEYLKQAIASKEEEVKKYQDSLLNINQDVEQHLSVFIESLEEELVTLMKEISEYQSLLAKSNHRKTKTNLDSAILKKEKEAEVLKELLHRSKKDLLLQISISHTLEKIIGKYQEDIGEKKDEMENFDHLTIFDEVSINYIEEEKDKEKLKKIQDEIREIKNRKKYTKTPDEVYDQLEMLLASDDLVNKNDNKSENSIEIDDLFEEEPAEPKIKVVEMIPAQTIQAKTTQGGTSYGS